MHDFFTQAGAFIGNILHLLIKGSHDLLGSFGSDVQGFADGLGSSLGINHSLIHIIIFVVGLVLAIKGIRQLVHKAFVSGVILLIVGLSILSWTVG